ncbi:hypothetical protein DSO57_1034070, partial [Entomophthora muscae]
MDQTRGELHNLTHLQMVLGKIPCIGNKRHNGISPKPSAALGYFKRAMHQPFSTPCLLRILILLSINP